MRNGFGCLIQQTEIYKRLSDANDLINDLWHQQSPIQTKALATMGMNDE
ncbi:MAG: hypothetical protein ACI9UT_001421 [Flavobacteriales bacterium]|jgi:hypothetical protein